MQLNTTYQKVPAFAWLMGGHDDNTTFCVPASSSNGSRGFGKFCFPFQPHRWNFEPFNLIMPLVYTWTYFRTAIECSVYSALGIWKVVFTALYKALQLNNVHSFAVTHEKQQRRRKAIVLPNSVSCEEQHRSLLDPNNIHPSPLKNPMRQRPLRLPLLILDNPRRHIHRRKSPRSTLLAQRAGINAQH